MAVEDPILCNGSAKGNVTTTLPWYIDNSPVANDVSSPSHCCQVKSGLINVYKLVRDFFRIHLQNSLKYSKISHSVYQYTVGLLYSKITCTVKRLCVHYTILQPVNKTYHHIFTPQDLQPVWISFKWHFIQLFHQNLMFFKDMGYCWERDLLEIIENWVITDNMGLNFSKSDCIIGQNEVYDLSLSSCCVNTGPLPPWGLNVQSYAGQTKCM